MYKKILVTGAKGMLGSALCKLLRPSYEVSGIDKEECDITSKEKTNKLINSLSVDAVIHCAAYTEVDKAEVEPQKAFLVNAEGTKNIIEALKGKDCFFIYISTDYVFDGKKKEPYSEKDTSRPLGMYGKSKLEGEKAVRGFAKHLILRTSWLFGPNGKNFVDTAVHLLKEKQLLDVVDDQTGSPTYTLDFSMAIKNILDIYFNKGVEYGIYNVTNSGSCSWFELAQYILNLLNSNVKIRPISSRGLKRKANRPNNSALSNEKFYALTGYYLPFWQEAVKNYLDSIKEIYHS